MLLILGLFLEARLAFWVTLGIPISFAGALLTFPAAGLSINMISLFGFIVTLGMLIDDAIVVGEAILQAPLRGHGSTGGLDHRCQRGGASSGVCDPHDLHGVRADADDPWRHGEVLSVLPKLVIIVLLISLAEWLFVLPAHHQDAPGDDELGGVVERQAPEAVHETRCDESVAYDGDV